MCWGTWDRWVWRADTTATKAVAKKRKKERRREEERRRRNNKEKQKKKRIIMELEFWNIENNTKHKKIKKKIR